jgi:hypothetical protein
MRFCVLVRDKTGSQVYGIHGEEVSKQGGNVQHELANGYTVQIIVDEGAAPLPPAKTPPL